MMQPFNLQWAGLLLNKLYLLNEYEDVNVSRQYCVLNSLELRDTSVSDEINNSYCGT